MHSSKLTRRAGILPTIGLAAILAVTPTPATASSCGTPKMPEELATYAKKSYESGAPIYDGNIDGYRVVANVHKCVDDGRYGIYILVFRQPEEFKPALLGNDRYLNDHRPVDRGVYDSLLKKITKRLKEEGKMR